MPKAPFILPVAALLASMMSMPATSRSRVLDHPFDVGRGLKTCPPFGCCECTPAFGRCLLGDESSVESRCGLGPSCAEQCPGVLQWKPLYRLARSNEVKMVHSWWPGEHGPAPAKHWPPAPKSGRFAVMFSGELRNFVATFHIATSNLVDSTSGTVHMYFDVWTNPTNPLANVSRALALSHKNTMAYVEEDMRDEMAIILKENQWVESVLRYCAVEISRFDCPVSVTHLSQLRKMWRAYKLVRGSGISYDLVVRSRPDATILVPINLRELRDEFGSRPSAQRAGGHFIAIPERDKFMVTDVFAVGTMQAIGAFVTPPEPYNQAVSETYASEVMLRSGFVRKKMTLFEDFDESRILASYYDAVKDYKAAGEDDPFKDKRPWRLLDPAATRGGKFSPLILAKGAFDQLGDTACFEDGSSCIPFYRMRFTFLLYMPMEQWFRAGALCLPKNRVFTKQQSDFIVLVGVGSSAPPSLSPISAVKKLWEDSGWYCLRLPTLASAHAKSISFACNLRQEYEGDFQSEAFGLESLAFDGLHLQDIVCPGGGRRKLHAPRRKNEGGVYDYGRLWL